MIWLIFQDVFFISCCQRRELDKPEIKKYLVKWTDTSKLESLDITFMINTETTEFQVLVGIHEEVQDSDQNSNIVTFSLSKFFWFFVFHLSS